MILALAVLGSPLVSQAQDPAAEFKVVQQLRAEKKSAEALKRIDQVLAVYGNPQSRVGKQFSYFTPFFLWQKASVLTDMGEYDKACEVYKDLSSNAAYKDRARIDNSKVLPGWNDEGYAPLLTWLFSRKDWRVINRPLAPVAKKRCLRCSTSASPSWKIT